MEELKKKLKNIRLHVRTSPPVLKVLLIVVILLSMATLGTLRLVHNGIRSEIEELKSEAAGLEYANSELDRRMEDPDSLENMQQIAREELGMVDPDTVLIDIQ